MLIIKEDTLIHTDSSSDVIQHFGVKGMRWGQRRSRANVMPRVGQFSGRIKKNLVARKNMKRANEKKISALSKNDPKRRELINKNKDLTNMNQKAALRLVRNQKIKKGVAGAVSGASALALQYQLMKVTDPQKAENIKRMAKGAANVAGRAAKYGAAKAYNQAKYAMGGVAKRKYM